MNFFCTKNHYDNWVSAMGLSEEDIFCLDANEALAVAWMLFNVEDYQQRSGLDEAVF